MYFPQVVIMLKNKIVDGGFELHLTKLFSVFTLSKFIMTSCQSLKGSGTGTQTYRDMSLQRPRAYMETSWRKSSCDSWRHHSPRLSYLSQLRTGQERHSNIVVRDYKRPALHVHIKMCFKGLILRLMYTLLSDASSALYNLCWDCTL